MEVVVVVAALAEAPVAADPVPAAPVLAQAVAHRPVLQLEVRRALAPDHLAHMVVVTMAVARQYHIRLGLGHRRD